jgi:hypothetical protein
MASYGFLALFGPRATWPIVLLIVSIAPIAVWHYVHVAICVIKFIRES